MIECGEVVAEREGVVDIRIDANESCRGCGRCFGAGQSMVLPDVLNRVDARVGDRVEVEIPDTTGRRAVWLVYALPVAGLVLGYLAGFLLGRALGVDPDAAGAVAALAVVAIAAIIFYRRAGRLFGEARYAPRVRAIIARGLNGDERPDGPEDIQNV